MSRNVFSLAASRTVRNDSPAKQRLFDAVKTLLESHAPGEITTTMVLQEAGVARNTLYLHYESHAALLEAVLLSVFLDGVKSHLDMMNKALDEASSKDDFRRLAREIINNAQGRDRRDFRLSRCRLIAHADKSPRFQKILGDEQSLINERFAEFFTRLQQKGWMGKQMSAATAAVLVQAITLGRAIDDIAAKNLPPDDWNAAYMQIVDKVILG